MIVFALLLWPLFFSDVIFIMNFILQIFNIIKLNNFLILVIFYFSLCQSFFMGINVSI